MQAEVESIHTETLQPRAATGKETATFPDYLTNEGFLVRLEFVCY